MAVGTGPHPDTNLRMGGLSPGPRHLILWHGCPDGLRGLLLAEAAFKHRSHLGHVEGADGRAGDAGEVRQGEMSLVGGPAPARVWRPLVLWSCRTLGPLGRRHCPPAPPSHSVPWSAQTGPHVSFSMAARVRPCVVALLDAQYPRCRSPRGFRKMPTVSPAQGTKRPCNEARHSPPRPCGHNWGGPGACGASPVCSREHPLTCCWGWRRRQGPRAGPPG